MVVGLPGRFSNIRPSLKTLIRRVLRGSEGRRPHARASERQDARGPVTKSRVQSQTRLGPSRRAELLADYEAGAPVHAIAARFRVHRATVFEVVRRAGLPGRDPGLSTETRGRAASLYATGLTLAQVAEQIGVGIDAVRAAVLAEGGQIRPRGRMPRHLKTGAGWLVRDHGIRRVHASEGAAKRAVAATGATIRPRGRRVPVTA